MKVKKQLLEGNVLDKMNSNQLEISQVIYLIQINHYKLKFKIKI